MAEYKLLACERESVINLNDAEPVAYVSTTQNVMKRRLKKLAEQNPRDVKIDESDQYTLFAEVPKKWIKIRQPRKVSEEQRQESAERLRQYHKNKKESSDYEEDENEEDYYEDDDEGIVEEEE